MNHLLIGVVFSQNQESHGLVGGMRAKRGASGEIGRITNRNPQVLAAGRGVGEGGVK